MNLPSNGQNKWLRNDSACIIHTFLHHLHIVDAGHRVWGTHCPIKAAIIWINSIGRFSADGFHAVTWTNNRTFSHFHLRFRWFVSVRIPKLAGKEHTQTTHDDSMCCYFSLSAVVLYGVGHLIRHSSCACIRHNKRQHLWIILFSFFYVAHFFHCASASFLNLCLSIFLLKCLSKQNSVTPTTENIVTDSWIIYFQDLVSIYVCLMLLLLLSACCPVCWP